MKVAVIGASGFVGEAVYRRLAALADMTAIPLVHGSGSVWGLARTREPLVFADLMDIEALDAALAGCTHVVNCSRGKRDAMLAGLDNIIACCRRNGVRRLVHISSVAIYGMPAGVTEITEDSSTAGAAGYGAIKLRQDEKVIAAAGNGFEPVILCPSNITGRASRFMEDVWNALCAGQLALLDGGRRPFNVVDIDNLCHAVELALRAPAIRRPRYLIADAGTATWGRAVEELERQSGRRFDLAAVDEDAVAAAAAAPAARASLPRSLKHLVSSEVRAALREDPLLALADKKIRGLVGKLPPNLESRLRRSVEGAVRVPAAALQPDVDMALAAQQLARFRYSIDNARRELGYEPPVDLRAGIRSFLHWRHAWDGYLAGYEDLLAELAPGSAFAAP